MSASKICSMFKILHARIMEQQTDTDIKTEIQGTRSKTRGGCLKLQAVPSLVGTMFFLIQTYS